MPSIKFVFKRLFDMDYKEMFKRLDAVSKRAGKSKFTTFFDMVWCAYKYGAGYMDYDLLEFWNKNKEQRSTLLTRGINTNYVRKLNNKEYWHFLDNKSEFNVKYSKYINRGFIAPVKDNEEKVLEWLKTRDVIIAKPENLCSGKGILKIDVNEYRKEGKEKELYNYLVENNITLLEEVIKQCDEMNAIYPKSVNTIRVVTIIDPDGNPQIMACAMRIGANNSYVDNFNNGGLVIRVDPETGMTGKVAVNIKDEEFTKHPDTGAQIANIKVPKWEEVINTCKEAALVVPEVRYVGWDVAITPEGITLIEGNQIPGYDLYQMPQHMENKTGILPRIKQILKEA